MARDAQPLRQEYGIKPLDFGLDGVTGSVDGFGRLIALNTYHSHHGYVTLSTAAPFPEGERYNPAAVRAYRAALGAWNVAGFGPYTDDVPYLRPARLLDSAIPEIELYVASRKATESHRRGTLRSTTFAHGGGALQRWQIENVTPRWQGQLSLQRCAYTQLTEGGPVAMPDTLNRVTFSDGVLAFENPALRMAAAIAGLPEAPAWETESRAPVPIDIAGQAGTFTLAYAFGQDAPAARANALALLHVDAQQALETQRQQWRGWLADTHPIDLMRRSLVYGRMMATPTGTANDSVCILTDHMLLPLSWNRDAYYVARALLSWHPAMHDLVRRHLLWLFETADHPGGIWARCYMANGKVKDRAYQLDQQLYPLLELADYVRETGDRSIVDRVRAQFAPVNAALLARRASHAWLFPTDETPADDPVALPYHLSSHILLWHTLQQLAAAGIEDAFALDADAIRAAVNAHFVAPHGDISLYAYATDGHGQHRFYHDANDMPLALAPSWGFVPASDPVWRATIDFAFSQANQGGYYSGSIYQPRNGLGSVHTPAAWPLGTVQEYVIARTLDDTAAEQHALRRLYHQSLWDGSLPEAVNPEAHPKVKSRHWFAWPNAALACEMLGAFAPERKERDPGRIALDDLYDPWP